MFDVSEYVHQLKNGQWIVAYWDAQANQYQAPMTTEEKKANGGAHTWFAKSLEGLGGYIYKNRSDAARRARMIFDQDSILS